jgi:hypothetical protein
MRTARRRPPSRRSSRAGAATLDYILVLGIILPMLAIAMPMGRRIIQLAYEMVCLMIAWPFL